MILLIKLLKKSTPEALQQQASLLVDARISEGDSIAVVRRLSAARSMGEIEAAVSVASLVDTKGAPDDLKDRIRAWSSRRWGGCAWDVVHGDATALRNYRFIAKAAVHITEANHKWMWFVYLLAPIGTAKPDNSRARHLDGSLVSEDED
jgi:hypothetical protein